MATSQMEFLTKMDFASMNDNLKRAVKALQEGEIVLLLDAHERENEADLIIAAEKIKASSMNFLIKQGSGVVCLALPKKRLDRLGLPLMIPDNTNFFQTAFTVSIEAKTGVTTGVSAKDRAHTIMVAMADDAESSDLARPGHVFPLAAQKNGVFDRMGHTEGSVDLMRIANLKPGAVLCELMNDDGSMTTGDDRSRFAQKFNIPVVTIEEILFYRMQTEDIFSKTSKTLKTRFGQLVWHSFKFLDAIVVDIFHKDICRLDLEKPFNISSVASDHLAMRFMAQILHQSNDDPLVGALLNVEQGKSELAIMATVTKNSPIIKTKEERALRAHAAICRSLCELKIKALAKASVSHELARIAQDYFSIKVE